MKEEIEEKKLHIGELRGGTGFWDVLKNIGNIEKRRKARAIREANKLLIKDERRELDKLSKRYIWNFTLKPMLFSLPFLPLLLLVRGPIKTGLTGVINQPLIGLLGLLLILIIIINYAVKRLGKTPLIERRLQQFVFGFAGIALLLKSSLGLVWFYLISVLVLRIFVKKIMGTD